MNKRLQKRLDKLAQKDARLELLRKKAGFILDTETKNCLVCDKKLYDEISFCCDECKEYFLNCMIESKPVSIQINKQLTIQTKKYNEIEQIKKKYTDHFIIRMPERYKSKMKKEVSYKMDIATFAHLNAEEKANKILDDMFNQRKHIK